MQNKAKLSFLYYNKGMGIFEKKEKTPSQTVVEDVCKITKGEKL